MSAADDLNPIAVRTGWMRGPKLVPEIQTPKTPPAVSPVESRLAICRGCSHFRTSPIQHCTRCGCALQLKARLARAHCPIGKW